jgi:4-diphosphocytidyl-2-C-methyl-D-erythritol kinase
MILFPNAKINLGLNVVEKRQDGFHNIETIFYPIPLCDALEVVPADKDCTSFSTSGLSVPGNPASNLVLRACTLLSSIIPHNHARQSAVTSSSPPMLSHYQVHLHKVIPMGAGLGGGSSDGAFTIKLLDQLRGLNLSAEEMERIALELGSDAPFFIGNRPVYATGRGDQFAPCAIDLSGFHLVVVKPDVHISTAEAYAMITPKHPAKPLNELILGEIDQWKEMITNDFEEPLFKRYPAIAAIKQNLYDAGACYASMTGSGSAVFGLFREDPPFGSQLFPGCFFWKSQI